MQKYIFPISIVLAIGLTILGSYWYYQNNNQAIDTSIEEKANEENCKIKTYSNKTYMDFSFEYDCKDELNEELLYENAYSINFTKVVENSTCVSKLSVTPNVYESSLYRDIPDENIEIIEKEGSENYSFARFRTMQGWQYAAFDFTQDSKLEYQEGNYYTGVTPYFNINPEIDNTINIGEEALTFTNGSFSMEIFSEAEECTNFFDEFYLNINQKG